MPFLANFLAYSIGIPINYAVHARYSFRAARSKKGLYLYIIVCLLAYLVNLIVLSLAVRIFPANMAQILAIASYIVSSYLLQAKIVFGKPQAPPSAQQG
jgi:putative flippase GtrA